MTKQLVSCPFCGGKAKRIWYDGFPSVGCSKCNAATGMFTNGKMASAEAAWNTRTHSQQDGEVS